MITDNYFHKAIPPPAVVSKKQRKRFVSGALSAPDRSRAAKQSNSASAGADFLRKDSLFKDGDGFLPPLWRFASLVLIGKEWA